MAIVTHLNDVFMVRLDFHDMPGNRAMNVLHYRLDSVSVPGGGLWAGAQTYEVAPLLAEAVYDLLSVEWKKFASNFVNFRTCSAQNISPLPKSRQYTHDPGAGVEGEVQDEALPLQDAVTILKRGPGASRQNMGRVFVVGFPESAQSAGIINQATVNLMEPFINRLGEIVEVTLNGDTLNFYPVLWSEDPGPPLVTTVIPILETALSNNIMKTQRRRRPGKGI